MECNLIGAFSIVVFNRQHSLPVLFLTFVALATEACEPQSDFIEDASPFMVLEARTPPDGREAIISRSESFAARHEMRLKAEPSQSPEPRFSLALVRHDLNIIAGTVGIGNRTLVTAVSRGQPTERHRRQVEAYLCEVMLHDC